MAAESTPPPIRTLLLSGGNQHDWRTNSRILGHILTDSGRFDVRVCEAPGGLSARMLAGFDLVVDDDSGPARGDDAERALADFVAAGHGLVVTRGAMSAASEAQAIGPGVRQVSKLWPAKPAPASTAPAGFVTVRFSTPDDPIVRGLADGVRVADRLPRSVAISDIAKTVAATSDGVPLLVTSGNGPDRVACIVLGYDASAMHENVFVALVARTCEWAGSGTVTLPATLGLPRPDHGAIKALLVTGGHDHEVSFYALFQGYKDLDWVPILTSSDAFKNDLRGKYDVVIMYDFSRDLDERGKKNLRDYVESGAGVVVLHHALLNYQTWTWWNTDVVGGSYRLSREGTRGSSTVKNDQELYVTPVGEHPVTAGLAPFHITDESYKNMRFSPKIRPLLATDNPTSDTNVAWLGPDERYRVVAIQLGHGHTAHAHPSYRKLIHNAVVWAAHKSK
jgi:type 1 glutamine amidotransferase